MSADAMKSKEYIADKMSDVFKKQGDQILKLESERS